MAVPIETLRTGARHRRSRIGPLVHALRMVLLISIFGLIRTEHRHWTASQHLRPHHAITTTQIQSFLPDAAALSEVNTDDGSQVVLNGASEPIGQILQSAPASDRVVGFSGPTNLVIAVDEQRRIIGVDILASADTAEHVADVRSDRRFLSSWNGIELDQVSGRTDIDVVSGATLTSLAIIEGMASRFGTAQPSMKFPERLSTSEILPFLAGASRLVPSPTYPYLTTILDAQGRPIGSAFRTSPACDHLNGYQGPSDVLVVLDRDLTVAGLQIRRSYDNQPYVNYVREDRYFWSLFQGKTLRELASMTVEREPVEGVSGATMTSQALASHLPIAASKARRKRPERPWLRVSVRDLGSVALLLGALWMSLTRRPVPRAIRRLFQALVIIYLGFLNGDMVSQAVLLGWTQHGMPWRLAPGFSLLVAAAILVPLLTRQQVYCHHLCPFGALQQVVRPRRRWRLTISARWQGWLKRLPALLLGVVLVGVMRHSRLNLAEIEPFHAFLWPAVGAATVAIAMVGLTASALTPMAYCRFGCPTGALLKYVRFHAKRRQLTLGDAWAVLLVLLAMALR